MKSKYPISLCCGSTTKIGYYSLKDSVAQIGTFCWKCNKLCKYNYSNNFYNYNGDIILDIKIIRKLKLNKINNGSC